MDKENQGGSDSENRTPRKEGKNGEKSNGDDSDTSTPLSARSENIMDSDTSLLQKSILSPSLEAEGNIQDLFSSPSTESTQRLSLNVFDPYRDQQATSSDVCFLNKLNEAKNALVSTSVVHQSEYGAEAEQSFLSDSSELNTTILEKESSESTQTLEQPTIPSAEEATETTEGGTETTEGGTDTTEGGTDTTEGGTETTEGGTEAVEGGTVTAETPRENFDEHRPTHENVDRLIEELTERFSDTIIGDFIPIYNEQLELSSEPFPGIPRAPPTTPKKLSVLITEKYDLQFERDLLFLQTTLLTRALGQHVASTESILPAGYTASLESLRRLPRHVLHQLVEEIRRPESEHPSARYPRRLSIEVQSEVTCILPDPNLLRDTVAQLPAESGSTSENLALLSDDVASTSSSSDPIRTEAEYPYEGPSSGELPSTSTHRPLFGGIDNATLGSSDTPLRFDIYYEAYKLAKSVPREYLERCMIQTFGRKVTKEEVREYFERKKAHLAAQAAAHPLSNTAASTSSAQSDEADTLAVRSFLERISQESRSQPAEQVTPTTETAPDLQFRPSRALPTGEIEYLAPRETTPIPELPIPRLNSDHPSDTDLPSHPYEDTCEQPVRIVASSSNAARLVPPSHQHEASVPVGVSLESLPIGAGSFTNTEQLTSEDTAGPSTSQRAPSQLETPQRGIPTLPSTYINPDDIPIRPREENPRTHPLVTDFYNTCRGFPVEVIQQYCPGFYIPPPRSPPQEHQSPKRSKKPARSTQESPATRVPQGSRSAQVSPATSVPQGSPGSHSVQGSPATRVPQGTRSVQGSPATRVPQGSPRSHSVQGSPTTRVPQGTRSVQGSPTTRVPQGSHSVQGSPATRVPQGNRSVQGSPATRVPQGSPGSGSVQGSPATRVPQGSPVQLSPATRVPQGSPGAHSVQGSPATRVPQGTRSVQGSPATRVPQGSPGSGSVQGSPATRVPQGSPVQLSPATRVPQGSPGLRSAGVSSTTRIPQGSPGARLAQVSSKTRVPQGSPGLRSSVGSGSRLPTGSPESRLSPGATGARLSPGSPGAQISQRSPVADLSQRSPGARSSQGSPGARISQGTPGARLSQGSLGVRVSPGSPGGRLSQGSPGAQSSQGSPGSRSSQGSPGSRSSQGSPGSRSFRGSPRTRPSRGSPRPRSFLESSGSRSSLGSLGTRSSLGSPGTRSSRESPVSQLFQSTPESADNDQSQEEPLVQEKSFDDTVRAELSLGNTNSSSSFISLDLNFYQEEDDETIDFDKTSVYSYSLIEIPKYSLLEEQEERSRTEAIALLRDQLILETRLKKVTHSIENEPCMYPEVANAMGDLINQDSLDKEAQNPQGDLDNKLALNAMMDRLSMAETDCERLKEQVSDLKRELKSSRQKTVSVESEVAALKERETTLNALIEELKAQATAIPDASATKDAEITELKAREEALMGALKEAQALLKQNEHKLKELQQKEVKLADDLCTRTQSEVQISRVMNEYEKSISSLVAENEKMKKERDTAQMHLSNIEMAFSDVHQKYERCKQIVQGYKDNESSFKQDIALNRDTIAKQEEKYEMLKAHAMAQLEKSNHELGHMKKQYETEIAKITTQLKRIEIKNSALQESLHQKIKECEQLSAVCDEFIGIITKILLVLILSACSVALMTSLRLVKIG